MTAQLFEKKRRGVVAGGNWIVDHVKMIDVWPAQDALANISAQSDGNGGGPYNVAKNLAKLGCGFPLAGVGLIGHDTNGEKILQDCHAHAIETAAIHKTSAAPTSYTDVMTVTGSGRRTFFHQHGANALLDLPHFNLASTNARIFYLGYLCLLRSLDSVDEVGWTRGSRLFQQASALGMTTVADLVSNETIDFPATVNPSLPHLDYLFLNEFELARLAGGEAGKKPAQLESQAREVLRRGVRGAVIVHLPEGAVCVAKDSPAIVQPSVRMPANLVVGTAGAGDAFSAGVIMGLHEGWNFEHCLELGVCVAAASLRDATCSAAIESWQNCLALGRKMGFHAGIKIKMIRSLDQKLAAIRAAPQTAKDFIIADAKDADMAFGVRSPGPRSYLSAHGARPAQFSPEVWSREEYGYRNLPEFLDIIREVVQQGLVDIMLMSAYVNEQLTIKEGLFKNSAITPAARANDTTDVWAVRHGCYTREPSQPFRSANIDHIQCGQIECDRTTADFPGANLGLYSLTFVNELKQDREALLWYKSFREEAERKQFRHFLEVFDPNVNSGIAPEKIGEFINDNIIRTLAGVPESGRPVFLKIVYHGPKAMEELAQYDPKMVVGILGGSAGTTYDAFKLIHDAQKYGARAALYGRKINNAEHQLAFIEMLRLITQGKISPEEAVRAYHGVLQAKNIKPHRSLEADLQATDQAMSYDGSATRRATVEIRNNPLAKPKAGAPSSENSSWPKRADGSPDFDQMNSAQRLAYHRARLG